MVSRCLSSVTLVAALAAAGVAGWAVSLPVEDWTLSGPFGGTATSVALDPQQPTSVLAGAMNSLLYSSGDGGATWALIDFPQHPLSTVTSILVDPSDSKHYFVGITAADGGGLFESQNGGRTWSVVKDISDFGVRALAASASNPSRFIAGTLHGVMLSDDCGKTWKRISDPQNAEMEGITSVAVDPSDANIIYAGTPHLPWKTTDAGKTWESIHTGMIDDSDVFSMFVDPSAPNNVLASACSGIYSSGDRGELWHKLLGIPNTSRRTHVVREDPQASNVIYAGTTTGLFKSTDSGKAWKTLTNIPVNAMAFNRAAPYSMYLALEYEGIGKSNDGGSAIELVNKGFVDRRITGLTVSGNKLMAFESQGGESSGLFVSANRGETWTQLRTTRGLNGVHLRSVTGFAGRGEILLAASHREMYKSIDGGGAWKPLPIRRLFPAPEPPKPKTATRTATSSARSRTARRPVRTVAPKPVVKEISVSEISGLYSVKTDAKELVFAATDLGLLKSDDAGEHWTLVDIPGSTAATALYGAEGGGSLILKASGGLYLSKDLGDHWNQIVFPLPVSDINDVALAASDAGSVLVATRVGLYSSSDGGSTWSSDGNKGLPASTVATVLYSPARHEAFAVEYGNLFARKDGDSSWSAVPSSLPSLKIRQLWSPDNNSERVYGITTNLGVLIRD
ncbi:MAG: hypothetical protein JO340_06025 [Acidobacteriaceae bacterium]|nr:hypothetical protein [Acidobacteriaceae bacterium]